MFLPLSPKYEALQTALSLIKSLIQQFIPPTALGYRHDQMIGVSSLVFKMDYIHPVKLL